MGQRRSTSGAIAHGQGLGINCGESLTRTGYPVKFEADNDCVCVCVYIYVCANSLMLQ